MEMQIASIEGHSRGRSNLAETVSSLTQRRGHFADPVIM